MPGYFRKPVILLAIQYTGDNLVAIGTFLGQGTVWYWNGGDQTLSIPSSIGAEIAHFTDWIVRENGVLHVLTDEAFQAQFGSVDTAQAIATVADLIEYSILRP